MLTIFKKLFGKSQPKAAPAVAAAPLVPSAPMPTIEVAHLSLAAITARFSDEMKAMLVREPAPEATVALPIPTILKQLPAGCVKMSLASLQRQAHGLIKPLPPGDKRTVDVPLAEVFRHVRLHALRRRSDQRPVSVPENGYNLFGDSTNPYAVAPDSDVPQPQILDLTRELASDGPRVLKMDDGLREHFGSVSPANSQPVSAVSASEFKLEMPAAASRNIALQPEPRPEPVPVAPAPIPKPEGPVLSLKVAPLAASWPDEIRGEVAALEAETVVTLPLSEVAAGLAKGRVMFSWGQIRAWLEPSAPEPTAAGEDIALQLPLKIVAPAFLAASRKPAAERKSVVMDESIPALFTGRAAEPEQPVPQEEPATAATPEVVVPVAVPAAKPDFHKIPETVGEIFGQPQKQNWTPAEIVAGTVKLPGVSGAVVALQEGLQVASQLPDGVKSEVVAAFLPQIFARLNQYSGEMKLGEVDDLLFTTHGAHCQIYRLGYVYLAVLGKPGESLPWHELRLISEELARQTHQ